MFSLFFTTNLNQPASERTSDRVFVLRDSSRRLCASVFLLITARSQSETRTMPFCRKQMCFTQCAGMYDVLNLHNPSYFALFVSGENCKNTHLIFTVRSRNIRGNAREKWRPKHAFSFYRLTSLSSLQRLYSMTLTTLSRIRLNSNFLDQKTSFRTVPGIVIHTQLRSLHSLLSHRNLPLQEYKVIPRKHQQFGHNLPRQVLRYHIFAMSMFSSK